MNTIRTSIYHELSTPHLCSAHESIPPGLNGTVPDSQKSAKSGSSMRLNKKLICKVKITDKKKPKKSIGKFWKVRGGKVSAFLFPNTRFIS